MHCIMQEKAKDMKLLPVKRKNNQSHMRPKNNDCIWLLDAPKASSHLRYLHWTFVSTLQLYLLWQEAKAWSGEREFT